jgi:hypothetical protein
MLSAAYDYIINYQPDKSNTGIHIDERGLAF